METHKLRTDVDAANPRTTKPGIRCAGKVGGARCPSTGAYFVTKDGGPFCGQAPCSSAPPIARVVRAAQDVVAGDNETSLDELSAALASLPDGACTDYPRPTQDNVVKRIVDWLRAGGNEQRARGTVAFEAAVMPMYLELASQIEATWGARTETAAPAETMNTERRGSK